MLNLFNIKTANQFHINIPGTLKQQCLIDKVIQKGPLHYAEGIVIDDETGETLSVVIDYSKTVALNNSHKSPVRFIPTFSVSRKGSGHFKYIGLFKLNLKSNIS